MFFHQCLRHDGGDLASDAALSELVVQTLLDHVAEFSLSFGSAEIEGKGVHLPLGEFGAQKDETYLGSITVSDNHPPSLFNHAGNVRTGLTSSVKLVGYGLMVLIFDQRVAADSNHCFLWHPLSPYK
jgi:hypothetical protein